MRTSLHPPIPDQSTSYVSHMKARNLFAIFARKNLILKRCWKTCFWTHSALTPPIFVQIKLLVAQMKASDSLDIFKCCQIFLERIDCSSSQKPPNQGFLEMRASIAPPILVQIEMLVAQNVSYTCIHIFWW